MKLAVTAWKFDPEGLGQGLADQATIAESMGFDAFWLPENHFSGPAAIPSPLMLLAAVASRTTTIGLGSTSYLLPIRHPILAAEEVAVLDRLSGGRVILGLGRGFQDAMFKTFKIPTKNKRQIFRENLSLMIRAWQGEAIDEHDGQPVYLSPLPVQKPHPPLWVAAFGPLAIKQAGTLGLPYIASPVESIGTLRNNIEAHKGHVADAGLPATDVVPVMRTVFVSKHSAKVSKVRQALEKESASRFREQDVAVDDWAIVGEPSEVNERIHAYREQTGMNYLIARGRLPGIESADQVLSHELLLSLTS